MLLEGLKVVEMSTWIAAPSCAMILGEWGADVVKVEGPDGDATRGFYPDTPDSPANPIFSMENRGKRGVVLDIHKPDGRAALIELIKGADVFVTNLRRGSMHRTRLDYDSIKEIAPRLVYASVTGYGLEGEDVDRPAFDSAAFWACSGVAASTIPPDVEPFSSRPGFGDHVTALALLSGVLAAVVAQRATGQGRLVEASLVRAGVYALGWDTSIHARFGEATTALPGGQRLSPIGGFFRTADGRRLSVGARGAKCVPAILAGLGLEWVLTDPDLGPPFTDRDRIARVRALVDQAYAKLTFEEAAAMLTKSDAIWAPLNTLDDAASDPQVRAAGCFVATPDRWGGAFEAPASPIRFRASEAGPRRPAPGLGEHTSEVLAEAGLSADAIEALLSSGAAGPRG